MIEDKNLPALYHAYDQAAIKGQKDYNRLIGGNLLLTVLSASLLLYSFQADWIKQILAGISAFLLFASIFLFWFIRTKRYDQTWIQARAAAESVKKSAWLYMTCAEPYPRYLSAAEVDEKFLKDLESILEGNRHLKRTDDQANITQAMKQVRAADVGTRKHTYINKRLHKQWEWYIKRSREHETYEKWWYRGTIAGQILAMVASVLLIFFPKSLWRPTGVLTTFVSAAVAWVQTRRFQETSQAYAVSAQQLVLISDKSVHVTEESHLSTFVEEAESIVFKEHSIWVTRRKS